MRCAVLCLLWTVTVVRPLQASELELKVKAAYIYNFTTFIDWPGDEKQPSGEPFRICVYGDTPLRTILGELTNRSAKGRPIKVVPVRELSTVPACHLLIVGRSAETHLPLILQRFKGTAVVTVSDLPQFVQLGGMIGFITEKGRVKVEINQRVVRESGVRLSAKLLEISRVVQ